MAKIVFSGVGITDIRGKVGAEVFSRNRYGAFSRAFVVPANTTTSARTAQRAQYASLCSAWLALSSINKALWSKEALRHLRKPVVGSVYFSTGFNYFVQCNFNRLIAGKSILSAPVAANALSPLRSFVVSALDPSNFFLSCVRAGGSTSIGVNACLAIYASACVSSGITYKRSELRLVSVLAGPASLSNIDIYTDYKNIFGAPISDKRIFLKCKAINNNNGTASKFVLCFGDVV